MCVLPLTTHFDLENVSVFIGFMLLEMKRHLGQVAYEKRFYGCSVFAC